MKILAALCIALAMSTATATWKAISLTAEVAAISATAAARAARHSREMAEAKADHRRQMARAKAKARLRRIAVTVPLMGGAAAAHFEREDYLQWKEQHPDAAFSDYVEEVVADSGEFMDEVLQALPEWMRPEPDTISSALESLLRETLQ